MNTLFLHMPKCAGSSMREILRKEFYITNDSDSFFKFPQEKRTKLILNSLKSPEKLTGNSFIFGHFFTVKYLGDLSNNKTNFRLITFLRDPIERLASHYNYWQNNKFSHYVRIKWIERIGHLKNFVCQKR